jgi:hypothetical protein
MMMVVAARGASEVFDAPGRQWVDEVFGIARFAEREAMESTRSPCRMGALRDWLVRRSVAQPAPPSRG